MSLKSVLSMPFAKDALLQRLNAAMEQSALGEIGMAGAWRNEADTTSASAKSGTPTAALTQGNEPQGGINKAA